MQFLDFALRFGEWQLSVTDWFDRNNQAIWRILAVILLSWLISHFAEKGLKRILERTIRNDLYQSPNDREKRLTTLTNLGAGIIRFIVWITGSIVIVSLLGVNTAPFLASAGVIGIGLGLGAQKLINDLVSGVFIISENQYRIGDYVELEGVSGNVEDITIRTTVLRDLSGAVHHVPNGSIVVATNMSMGFGQINLDITVEGDTDINKLRTIIDKVGEKISSEPELKEEIIEAPRFIRIVDYTGTGVTVKVMGKTTGGKQLEIKSVFYTELKQALDQAKIKLAFVPYGMPANTKKRK
ncbi:MAG: mechanosensitive ion channel family protein [bacterium]|nr:mechanosensitive ion channel family protein [bacterium]